VLSSLTSDTTHHSSILAPVSPLPLLCHRGAPTLVSLLLPTTPTWVPLDAGLLLEPLSCLAALLLTGMATGAAFPRKGDVAPLF
jgi:hypothetical protein